MKNIIPLVLIVLFEVTGNSFLSHGMRQAGVSAQMLTNPWFMIGVLLLIGYFISFLTALSRLELSYVLPMTAVGYVLTALVAWKFLGETISLGRWLGMALIGVGTVLVGFSEHNSKGAA